MKIAICDDELQYLKSIELSVQNWGIRNHIPIQVVCFDNGDDLVLAHQKNPFDLILLDIIMPLFSGLDTAKEIRIFDKTVKIIFLTSSPEFAISSYSVKAANYILKPFGDAELYTALDDIYENIQNSAQHLILRSTNGVHKILLNQIEYIESQNKLLLFFLSNGEILKTTEPLYYFQDKLTLDDGFYKCHRSYIINLQKISSFTKNEIKMISGCRIPIARSISKTFHDIYFSFMFRE